jgi:hypothetical protein
MNWPIVGSVVAGTVLGAVAAQYIPWPRKKGDTAFLLKKASGQAKFYSPVILRGTLWVCSGCFVVMLKTLLEWKSAKVIEEIDVKILWVGVAATAVDKWLTYMDTTVARFKDEKKKREEGANGTTPPIPG